MKNPITNSAQNLPPLMPIPLFCQLHNISRALFYKLPEQDRPRVTRVGSKPMIRAADAIEWAARLAAKSTTGDEA